MKIVIILLIILSLSVFIVFYSKPKNIDPTTTPTNTYQEVSIENQDIFLKGIANAKDYQFSSTPKAVILPHDIASAKLIASFFKSISTNPPETIILIGPNHHNSGDNPYISADNFWKTPTGNIESDSSILNKLDIKIDNSIISKDHSITAVLPFLSYYLPNTKVVPIIIRTDASLKEVTALSNQLRYLISEKVLLIGSIDFSHYLNSYNAKQKDQETIQAINDLNYNWLLERNSDHIDSPESLTSILQIFSEKNLNMNIINRTDSGEIQNNPDIETTSHFLIIFD